MLSSDFFRNRTALAFTMLLLNIWRVWRNSIPLNILSFENILPRIFFSGNSQNNSQKAIDIEKFLSKIGTSSAKKLFSAQSSLSAIQIYSPLAKSNPFAHCLNGDPLLVLLYTIWRTCDRFRYSSMISLLLSVLQSSRMMTSKSWNVWLNMESKRCLR